MTMTDYIKSKVNYSNIKKAAACGKDKAQQVADFFKEEVDVIKERDPAMKSPLEVILYPSFRVIIAYRIAHKLYEKKHYFQLYFYVLIFYKMIFSLHSHHH